MTDFQNSKSLVLSFYDALDAASGNEITEVLLEAVSPGIRANPEAPRCLYGRPKRGGWF
jgi:hypothetical protein